MALNIGIVGLPNVGKSTLFNCLTGSHGAQAANYPFCTIDPNVGIVSVPDERLDQLAALVKPAKVVPAAVEFVDIAGLVKGASKGEGLGNQFLAAIRNVDALCHVVRVFPDDNVLHVEGGIDPKRDRETVEAELMLSDLDFVEKRLEKTRTAAKSGDKEKQRELVLLEKLNETLQSGRLAGTLDLHEDEKVLMKGIPLLTWKPVIYAANVAEHQLKDLNAAALKKQLDLPDHVELIAVSAKVEEELADLSPDERREYLDGLGVSSSGLDQLIRAAYEALGYQTFFTAGPKEVRAWTVRRGATGPQAAGVIHTDFEKGFIRAETVAFADFIKHGGEHGAKDAGRLRSEGKEYIVQDGDVMHFRFNV